MRWNFILYSCVIIYMISIVSIISIISIGFLGFRRLRWRRGLPRYPLYLVMCYHFRSAILSRDERGESADGHRSVWKCESTLLVLACMAIIP